MPPPKNKEKILVIESNGPYGEQIARALEKENYAVTLVKNGTEGLKSIYDNLPHLILLDIVLDGADSYEIIEKKQAESMLAKIPLFLLSTEAVPINMHRIPVGVVSEFLVALHVSPEEIARRVNRHFGRAFEAPVSSTAKDSNKKKVVWVEDDKLIGTILAKKLTTSGLDLFHVKDGEEATAILKSVIPDVIVLDLVLPNMSGFDILQTIKKDSALNKVPVMILTNLSKQSDIERAKMLGAQKFLVKASVSLDEIVREVRALCR